MDPRKLPKVTRTEGGTEAVKTLTRHHSSRRHKAALPFSGILTADGECSVRSTVPLQICPPPPAPIAFQRPTNESQSHPDYKVSLVSFSYLISSKY